MRRFRGKGRTFPLQGRRHRETHSHGTVDFVRNARHQAPERRELLGFDQ